MALLVDRSPGLESHIETLLTGLLEGQQVLLGHLSEWVQVEVVSFV